MEEFLKSDLAVTIATFLAGAVATGLIWGTRTLIKRIKGSSNKLDDVLLPILEALNSAIDGLKNSTPVK